MWEIFHVRAEPKCSGKLPKPLEPERLVKRSTVPKLESFAELDGVVLLRVADYYHATLKQRAEAPGYLRERGLVHPEVIDHFKLGYASRTLGYRPRTRTGERVRCCAVNCSAWA